MRAVASSYLFLFLFTLVLWHPSEAGPLSERIIFVAEQNRLKKLFICRPDGRDLQRFSRQPGTQSQPAYSRVLERVFYVRPNGRYTEICSVDLLGQDLRSEVGMRARCYYPDVSPDGKRLLFSTDLWGQMEIAELELETGELERLTYDESINTYPRYSPSADSILFLSRRTGHSEVFHMELASKSVQQLTDTPFAKGMATWSKDATRFITTETRPPKFRKVLLEKDLQDGSERYLLPDLKGVSNPTYSVDGNRILFLQDDQLYTFDSSDTGPLPFPIRGRLKPEEALWVDYPLP